MKTLIKPLVLGAFVALSSFTPSFAGEGPAPLVVAPVKKEDNLEKILLVALVGFAITAFFGGGAATTTQGGDAAPAVDASKGKIIQKF